MHATIQQKANQYKKLWETIKIFSFQLELEGRKYHYVLYTRFNKPTGILIVDEEGDVVPYQQAKSVVAPFNYYNNIAIAGTTDLVREKTRDIKPVTDLYQFFQDQPTLFSDSSSIEEDYKNVLGMLSTIIEGQKGLNLIFEQLKDIDMEAREKRRVVTLEDVRAFVALNEQYQSILYRQGRVQQENKEAIGRLAGYIREKARPSGGSKRAVEVLTSFLASNVTRSLDQSLATFEEGMNGKRVRFGSGHEGIQQMLELYRQKTQHETETSLYPLLRNA